LASHQGIDELDLLIGVVLDGGLLDPTLDSSVGVDDAGRVVVGLDGLAPVGPVRRLNARATVTGA
jgi:hypothetical protein